MVVQNSQFWVLGDPVKGVFFGGADGTLPNWEDAVRFPSRENAEKAMGLDVVQRAEGLGDAEIRPVCIYVETVMTLTKPEET